MNGGDPHPPVLVVAGPTASGKSALAVELAHRLDGVVVNADSQQLYADLPVLTAQPTAEERARVPHRLYGVLTGDRRASAGWWAETAAAEIAAIRAAGQRPILAGGTGLYLSALMGGLSAVPPVPAEVSQRIRRDAETLGLAAMADRLAALDPEGARSLAPTDRQRILRALEVLEATGRPLWAWRRDAVRTAPPFAYELFVLLPERDRLYARCDRRVEAMVEAGAVEEVRALLARGYPSDLPVMRALGVAEFAAFLRGETDLATAIDRTRQSTRRYAKRQFTWWRHQRPEAGALDGRVHGSHVLNAQQSESLATEIVKKIKIPR